MRNTKAYVTVFLVISCAVALPIHARQKQQSKKPIPKIKQAILYTWALDTGICKIDTYAKTLESFQHNVRINKDEAEALRSTVKTGYPIFHIKASLKDSDIIPLKKLINNSRWHNFQPKDSDVKPRKPYLDECPPTLVLIWNDKKQVLQFPLNNTLRKDLPKGRLSSYHRMDDICSAISLIEKAYAKKPYLSAVSVKGKEYQEFEKERSHNLK